MNNKDRVQRFVEDGCLCGGHALIEEREDGYVFGVCEKCNDHVVLTNPNAERVAKLRAKATGNYKEAGDSFDRCDTDGFLSQHSLGITASLYNTQALILENGGADFPGLFEGDRRVNAKIVPGKFGSVWLLSDTEEARFGRRFVPTGERSRVQKQLGLDQRQEFAPAWAKLESNGTGLSGSVWVRVYRTDEFGADWNSHQ